MDAAKDTIEHARSTAKDTAAAAKDAAATAPAKARQVIGDNAVTWEAHLADGRWTGSVHRPDAVDCKNGTAAPGTSELSLDAQTLRGTVVSTSDGPACGSPTSITTGPVYLAMDQA